MELFFAVCTDGSREYHVHVPNEKLKTLRRTHEALVLRARRILGARVIRVLRCEVEDELLVGLLSKFMDVAVAAQAAYQKDTIKL